MFPCNPLQQSWPCTLHFHLNWFSLRKTTCGPLQFLPPSSVVNVVFASKEFLPS